MSFRVVRPIAAAFKPIRKSLPHNRMRRALASDWLDSANQLAIRRTAEHGRLPASFAHPDTSEQLSYGPHM